MSTSEHAGAAVSAAGRIERLLQAAFKDPAAPAADEVRRLVADLQSRVEQAESENRHLRQAQRSLEAYRDRYVDLYDFAPLGYVTLDEDGYVQEINLAGARMLEADRDALIGYPFSRHVTPDDAATFLGHVRQCLAQRRETTCELCLVSGGGRVIAVQLRSIPIESLEADDAMLCKTAISDISQRRQMEQALRSSQEFLQTVIDAAPDALLVLTRDFHVALANRAASLILGDDRHAAAASPQLAPRMQTVLRMAKQVIEDCRPATTLEVWEQGDGGSFYVEVRAAPVCDAAGRPTHVVEACRDVSKRYRAEAALRAERDFVSALMETAGALVLVLDPQGRILRCSRTCEAAFGRKAKDAEGVSLLDLLPYREDMQRVRQALAELQSANAHCQYECDWSLEGGQRRRITWSATTVSDEQGRVQYLIATGLDITELRAAEETARKALQWLCEQGL